MVQENALTLIGRLTNPEVQRLWSLIPFLSSRWNLKGKSIGSDLGRGRFQFRFEFEKDLLKVLNNRLYHFDEWMVIIQRWEPVIFDTFPSEIPFSIDVQGIPLHYWKPKMLTDIGDHAGEIIDHELTPAVARVKVLVNGLLPLVKEAMIDFLAGSETLVILEYKRLKKHCSHYNRLSHEKSDCPGLQSKRHTQSQRSNTPQETNIKMDLIHLTDLCFKHFQDTQVELLGRHWTTYHIKLLISLSEEPQRNDPLITEPQVLGGLPLSLMITIEEIPIESLELTCGLKTEAMENKLPQICSGEKNII